MDKATMKKAYHITLDLEYLIKRMHKQADYIKELTTDEEYLVKTEIEAIKEAIESLQSTIESYEKLQEQLHVYIEGEDIE